MVAGRHPAESPDLLFDLLCFGEELVAIAIERVILWVIERGFDPGDLVEDLVAHVSDLFGDGAAELCDGSFSGEFIL